MHTFKVARTAYEADVIVDLPVKTHSRTGITCGLKNIRKGVLPGYEKRRTHTLGLDRGIVDLNRVMKSRTSRLWTASWVSEVRTPARRIEWPWRASSQARMSSPSMLCVPP